jgi:hypothetical protein
MAIYKFYKDHENKYGQIPEFYKDEAESILKNAKDGTLTKLKKLCNDDERFMFGVLQNFLMIPISRKLHKMKSDYHRKTAKRIKDKEIKLHKKIETKIKKQYQRWPMPDVETFKDNAYKIILSDKRIRLDLDSLNELVKKHEHEKKDWQGKTNIYFKDIINRTFLVSIEHSTLSDNEIYDHIATLLNCLKIKNTQGGLYSAKLIKPCCKTP